MQSLVDSLFRKCRHHYILVMMILTRICGSVGGLLVIYYVELTLPLPPVIRSHFRITSIVVVIGSSALTVLLALWETRSLRRTLRALALERPLAPEDAARAGSQAVQFVSRHHKHEAWLVPCTTWLPVMIVLKVLDDASGTILLNITLAVFMGISMALMATFFSVEYCMQPVIRHLLSRGVAIDYASMPVGRLQVRFGVCFTLIIMTTALMIATMARQRAADVFADPSNQAAAVQSLVQHCTYITAAAVAIGVLYSTLLTNSVAARVNSMVRAMELIERGELHERLTPTGNDEIDVVARRFNAMVSQLHVNDRTIRELNAGLERRVQERTSELQETVKELEATQQRLTDYNVQLEAARAGAEAANKAKSDFLANISHELRTPLNCTIGMTDVLLDMPMQGQQRKYTQMIRSSGEMLLDLLNAVLDFSKIEAGKLELERTEFDLHKTVEPVLELAAQRCTARGLELACYFDPRTPATLIGDPARLRQVVTNVANNAVKFTETGCVIVRITLAAETHDEVRLKFSVQDTGIGIPEDRFDRIFKSFSQVDASTTRKYGGTGLGLAISKQLCQLMGGDIAFQSRVGEGSTFWFTIPFTKTAGSRNAAADSVGPRPHRVLLVDDNELVATTTRSQLEGWRCRVDAAMDVDEAMRQVDRSVQHHDEYDVVLLDAAFVDTGVFGHFGTPLGNTARRRIVLLTVPFGKPVSDEQLQRAGARGYVTKPIMRKALFDALRSDGLSARLRSTTASAGVKTPPNHEPLGGEAAPSSAATGDERIPHTEYKGARILLAEDNEINRDVAVELLSRAGFVCDVVEDGRKAVEAVRGGGYDAVLMDCQMPEMDGLQATRQIRAWESETDGTGKPRKSTIPIVALTASATINERDRCLEAGMTDHVSKPLNIGRLVTAIDSALAAAASAGRSTRDIGRQTGGELIAPCDEPIRRESATASAESSSRSSVVEVAALVERCLGNSDLASRLIRKFADKLPDSVNRIVEAASAGDGEQTAKQAHALKGAAANLSANRLRDVASRLERAGRDGDTAAVASQLGELDAASDEFLAAVSEVLEETNSARTCQTAS